MGWTTPVTIVTGATIQASWANTHVRDNSRYLKGLDGAVAIQDDLSVAGNLTVPSDRIGVGVSSPSQPLHVAGTVILATDSAAATGGVGISQNGSDIAIATDNYGKALDLMNGQVYLEENAGAGNGNVGIGTNTPSAKLDVNGTAKATTFSGSGASLTNLPGGQLTGSVAASLLSGTIDNARLNSSVAHSGENVSQFTNDSGYLTLSDNLNATQLTAQIRVQDVSLADEASTNLNADSAGGFYLIRVAGTSIFGLVHCAAGATTTILLDPNSQFSTTGVEEGKTNIGLGGGNVVLLNKTGSTRAYKVLRLGGG